MAAHRLASRATLRREVEALRAERAALLAQKDRLSAECNDYACELVKLSGEVDGLKQEVKALRTQQAQAANDNSVTVPPMERDTSDPADQATHPTYIGDMWADPTRWRATGNDRPTLTLRTVREVTRP